MINQYRNDPVALIEHDLNHREHSGNRLGRWSAARNQGGNFTMPAVMTDSGFRWCEGSQSNTAATYKKFIDESLKEPAKVVIEAYQERVESEDDLRVFGKVTNISEETFGYNDSATLNIMVYEDKVVLYTNHYIWATVSLEVDPDLEPGGVWEFDTTVMDLGRVNMSKVRAVLVLDHKPSDPSINGYRSLQGAIASEDPPEPTEEPTPTDEPTEEPSPTATEVIPTDVPTVAPTTEVPTAEPTNTTAPRPERFTIHLPSLKNRAE